VKFDYDTVAISETEGNKKGRYQQWKHQLQQEAIVLGKSDIDLCHHTTTKQSSGTSTTGNKVAMHLPVICCIDNSS
jgi:hypothetical protein